MRTIFAGSSAFGIPSLQMLMEQKYPLLIVSQPDKASGRNLRTRPCPLAEYAQHHKLEIFKPVDINAPASVARVREFEPDLLITASYGSLIKRDLRQLPRCGAINLHPSLLPLYRGATPIQSSLLNGDKVTGVTVFRLTARMDAGPILCQQELSIAESDDFGSLHDKLALLSAELLAKLLPSLQTCSAPEFPQSEAVATYTHKLEKTDLLIDWDRPASEVLNKIRAFSPQPGAQTFRRGKPIKILAAKSNLKTSLGAPGSVAALGKDSGIEVNCRDRRLLLTKVQTAGKNAMDAWAWQLGARLTPGDSFDPPQISQPSNPTREEI